MKEESNMARIIADPECEGFNGLYAGGSLPLPPPQYDMVGMVRYMKQQNKSYFDLTKDEKEQFLI